MPLGAGSLSATSVCATTTSYLLFGKRPAFVFRNKEGTCCREYLQPAEACCMCMCASLLKRATQSCRG